MKLTKELIEGLFDDRTFQRGYNYFKYGHVIQRGKLPGGDLWGLVSGSREEPYKTRILLDEVNGMIKSCECSCPVQMWCKHCVALLLSWVNEPQLFFDVVPLISSLERRTKGELLTLFRKVLKEHPEISREVDLWLSLDEQQKQEILMEEREEPRKKEKNKSEQMNQTMMRKIDDYIQNILASKLDYYRISENISRLETVREIGESFEQKAAFTKAVEVYYLLIRNFLEVFRTGVDDSEGFFAGFNYETVSLFSNCMSKIDDQLFKDSFLPKIIELYLKDNYELGTGEMFDEIVTRDNISQIKNELIAFLKEREKLTEGEKERTSNGLARWPITTSSYSHRDYKRREIKEVLVKLYELIGQEEKLLEALKNTMKNLHDYLLTASLLTKLEHFNEALEILKKAQQVAYSDWDKSQLFSSYLALFKIFQSKGLTEKIVISEALEMAIYLLQRERGDNLNGKYREMKDFFRELGTEKQLLDLVKEKLRGTEGLVRILLFEGDITSAAEQFKQLPKTNNQLAMALAMKAKATGKLKLAFELVALPFARDYHFPYYWSNMELKKEEQQLIQLFLANLSKKELEVFIQKGRNKKTTLFIAEELLKIEPKLIYKLLVQEISRYKMKELLPIIKKLGKIEPLEAINVADNWVSTFVVRSHVYYDDVLRLVKIMKEIFSRRKHSKGEADWESYLSAFKQKYQTRKALMQKLQNEKLQ